MRRLIYIYSLLFSVMVAHTLLFSACAEEEGVIDDDSVSQLVPEDGFLKIRLHTLSDFTRSEETEPGIDLLNENLIRSVTLCLWPKGGDWLDTAEPYYMQTFRDINKAGEYVIRVPLTDDLTAHLFGVNSDRLCNVFVAVNVEPGEAKTPAQLRALSISSDFDTAQIQEDFAMDGSGVAQLTVVPGASFATAEIELMRAAAKIDLHVDVASQVVEELGNGVKKTWIPNLLSMQVMLNDGVRNSTLDPDPSDISDDDYFSTPVDLPYILTDSPEYDSAHDIHNAEYPYSQSYPFYTYPNEWNSHDPDSPGRSSMTLKIPWSDDGGASYKMCYYRVPVVSPDLDEIVRNTAYHVLLKVSVLGSFVPDEPVLVDDLSYQTADWGQEDIDIDIVEPRYLVVDQNDFDVNNHNEINIPFYTSHKTVVTDIKMTFYRFNFSDEGSKFPVTVTKTMNDLSKEKGGEFVFEYDFDNESDVLTVKHDLNIYEPMSMTSAGVSSLFDLTNGDGPSSSRSKVVLLPQILATINNAATGIKWFRKKTPVEDEYSVVQFEVTVQHEDMFLAGSNLFKETVRINQYPGMYIDAVTNDYAASNNNTVISGSGADGAVFINNNNSNISTNYVLGGNTNGYMTSIGLNSASYLNWNPNLYLITITRLPADTEFVLADTRANEINNSLTNASMGTKVTTPWPVTAVGGYNQAAPVSAEAIYPNSNVRQIRYYYPTREDEASQNLISPKFRICSSYAGTGNILNRLLARRRAAAYQETGYPAGRWRLPTFAEIKFIVKLSEEYKIPRLFGRYGNVSWNYWCANGLVTIPGKADTAKASYEFLSSTSSKNDNNERTRFVYDEWYWGGSTVNRNTFIWGDAPR